MSCIWVPLPATSSMYKRANIYRMANDTIVKFIELYRSCECLWNVSSEDYGSRLSRNAAYHEISRKMRIPGFGPREVARKIKNLRSAYQQEVRRIECNEQQTDGGARRPVYRPKVIWFDLLNEFLGNSEKLGQSDCQLNNPSKSVSKASSNSSKNLSSYESSMSSLESSPTSNRRRSSADNTFRNEKLQRKRKKQEDGEKDDEDTIETEDYDSFGKYVAASLAKMPFEYAVSAETEIHSVIIKYKVYAMRKIVYPTTTTRRMKRQQSSTYLPPSNFSSTLRLHSEETRPSSADSIRNASA